MKSSWFSANRPTDRRHTQRPTDTSNAMQMNVPRIFAKPFIEHERRRSYCGSYVWRRRNDNKWKHRTHTLSRAPTHIHKHANGWESMWRTQTEPIDCPLVCVRVSVGWSSCFTMCKKYTFDCYSVCRRNKDSDTVENGIAERVVQAPFQLTHQYRTTNNIQIQWS